MVSDVCLLVQVFVSQKIIDLGLLDVLSLNYSLGNEFLSWVLFPVFLFIDKIEGIS